MVNGIRFVQLHFRKTFLRPVIGCCLAIALTACSFNTYGTSKVTETLIDGGMVYELSAFGLHIDTLARDPSATFGTYNAAYVFAANCNNQEPSLTAAFAADAPQASVVRASGLHLTAGPGEVGIVLGFEEKALLASIDRSASIERTLLLDVENFSKSRISVSVECND